MNLKGARGWLAAAGVLWFGACSTDGRSPSILVDGSLGQPPPDAELPAVAIADGAGGESPDDAGGAAPVQPPVAPDVAARAADAGLPRAVPEASPAVPPGPTRMGPCQGCVELVIPVTGPSQIASFQFVSPTPGRDLSAAFIEWRVQIPEADANPGFFIRTFVQNGPAVTYASVTENQRPLSMENFPPGQWVSLTMDLSAYPPSTDPESQQFDNRRVESVGVTLGTTDTSTSTGTIRVLLDSVAILGVPGAMSVEFATGVEGLLLNAYQVPAGTSQPIHHP